MQSKLLSRVLEHSLYFLEPLLSRAVQQQQATTTQAGDKDEQLAADILQLDTLIVSINFFRELLPRPLALPPSPGSKHLLDASEPPKKREGGKGKETLPLVLEYMSSSKRQYPQELVLLSTLSKHMNEEATAILWKGIYIPFKAIITMRIHRSGYCEQAFPVHAHVCHKHQHGQIDLFVWKLRESS